MANKKITELPFINTLTGSTVWDNPTYNTVVPVVLYGTTNQITVENFSKFMNLYTATTGSAGNTFVGPQTINNNVTITGNQTVNGNVNISGRLTVYEVVAQYETASVVFSSGSNKFGDAAGDKHEFTGSSNFLGSVYINGQDYTTYSSSNSTVFTNFSSSNSTYNTTFSSSNAAYITALSSSNSSTFTNFSSSNSTVFTNYSSSDSTKFTNYSASNSTVFTNYSSSNSTLITNYSSSINTNIYAISSSINSTLLGVSSSINTNIYAVSSSINSTLFAVSASINTNIYAISSSIDSTIKANLGATNDVVYRIQQATASIQSYTASLKTAILPNGTNLDVIGNLRVSGSTTLGDTNTDKVEVTGSVNVTGYVSASGINIYSTGTPEILSTNNLRLTADSSVVITADINGTPKIWDFDNGGTANLPGGGTISTPNTVDVIVGAGSAGTAQLANYNKANYFAVNDTVAFINVDAGATNKVWQYTSSGSLNIPGSIVKPDGGEYSASLTLTSSFHAFTASIGSTSNDYRIELNTIEAYTASLKAAAIVSSSTQIQNYNTFALTSSVNTFYGNQTISGSLHVRDGVTGSFKGNLDGTATYAGNVNIGNSSTNANYAMLFTTAGSNGYLTAYTDAFGGVLYNPSTNKLIVSGSVEVSGSFNVYGGNITGSILATNGVVSSSAQIPELFGLMQATASLNTTTGSLIGITNGIMALTASMKAAAIVSSSTQIQNYNLFAVTSSTNIFYGNQGFTGSIFISTTTISPNDTPTKIHTKAPPNGGHNIFIGTGGENITSGSTGAFYWGSLNTVLGKNSGWALTNGYANTIIGAGTANITTGYQNTIIGTYSAIGNFPTQSYNNTILGYSALQNFTKGESNIVIGSQAAYNLVTGSNNIYIGNTPSALVTTTSNNSVVIGSPNDISETSINNNIILANGSGNTRIRVNEIAGTQIFGALTSSQNVSVGTGALTSPGGADRFIAVYSGQDSSVILQDSVETWEMYMNDDLYFTTGSTNPKNVMSLRRLTGNVEVNEGNLVVDKGNVKIGTAGKGIDFSINTGGAGKSSQLLNDYEEGLHSATITPSTSGTVTLNTGYDTLSYVKVGSIVHVSGLLSVSSVSSPVGAFRISLPFQCVNLADAAGTSAASIVVNGTDTVNIPNFAGWVDELTSYIVVYRTDGTSVASTSANQLKANTDIYVHVTYRTS